MKVSVICTNYNKEEWLAEAIDSFLNQETAFDYEIIIVDDASTDQSPAIIRAYRDRYPEKIRAFFNDTNQGILKTWVAICREARGQYIARCDGDDFWTDPQKLQKQVDFLEAQTGSKWCNTDFDYVTATGEVIYPSAIQNQVIPFITDLETLISQKGMTMSSTWLVDRELMQEVNQVVNPEATDDTFDLQIELFKRTNLVFLPQSTTVYRMTENSDSRPVDGDKVAQRIKGLLKTQLAYIDVLDQLDYKRMTQLLVERDAEQELRLHDRMAHQSRLEAHITGYQQHQEHLEGQLEAYRHHQEELETQLAQRQQDLADLSGQLAQTAAELAAREEEVGLIKASRSWKLRNKLVKLLRG